MPMDLKNVVYSHSDCFDVLDIFLEQQKIFGIDDITIFSNCIFNETNDHVLYDDGDIYTERLKSCLEKLDDDIILYQHEDMFLYDKPDMEILEGYIKTLKNSEYSFIRLCKTGNCSLTPFTSTLYDINRNSVDFFAVQPTLWKRLDFINFLASSGGKNIWDLELQSRHIEHNSKGLLHYNNEPSRGGHYDSEVWPYVATAIVKGKWNFSEYATELGKIKKIKENLREKYT